MEAQVAPNPFQKHITFLRRGRADAFQVPLRRKLSSEGAESENLFAAVEALSAGGALINFKVEPGDA